MSLTARVLADGVPPPQARRCRRASPLPRATVAARRHQAQHHRCAAPLAPPLGSVRVVRCGVAGGGGARSVATEAPSLLGDVAAGEPRPTLHLRPFPVLALAKASTRTPTTNLTHPPCPLLASCRRARGTTLVLAATTQLTTQPTTQPQPQP